MSQHGHRGVMVSTDLAADFMMIPAKLILAFLEGGPHWPAPGRHARQGCERQVRRRVSALELPLRHRCAHRPPPDEPFIAPRQFFRRHHDPLECRLDL